MFMDDQRAPDRGPWIQTYTGVKFHFLAPQPDEVRIEDIAHALSNICRFTGHTKRHLSVAEHSVHASILVDGGLELAGLLHDASEAYIGDVSSPLKKVLPGFVELEHKIQAVIFRKFGLPPEIPEEIHVVDKLLVNIEARDLLGPALDGWYRGADVGNLGLREGWQPQQAEEMFLRRYRQLVSAGGSLG